MKSSRFLDSKQHSADNKNFLVFFLAFLYDDMSDLPENRLCRCCLKDINPVNHMEEIVYEDLTAENQTLTALQTYLDLTGLLIDQIEVTSSLQICSDCQPNLRDAFTFRKLCLNSHNLLSCVKQEHQEEVIHEEKVMLLDIPLVPVKLEASLKSEKLDKTPGRQVTRSSKQIQKAAKKLITKTKARKIVTSTEQKKHCRGGGAIEYFPANYLCTVCDTPAKNYAHLIRHRRNHSNNYKKPKDLRNCKECGQEKVANYEEHLAQVHPEYRPQKCLQCDASYINHKDLKDHLMSEHLEVEVHDCQNCGARFDKLTVLRRHVSENCGQPMENKTTYNCHVCGLAIAKVKDFGQHVFDKHPEEFRKYFFPCFRCKRVLMGQQKFTVCVKCEPWRKKRAEKMATKKISPQFKCDKCSNKFYEEEEFFCHQIGNHNMRTYCFQCAKPFWNRQEKRVHDKQVHHVKKVPTGHICETCGKSFKVNYYLEAHVLSHHKKAHLKCTYPGCEASFYLKTVLNRHMIATHQKDYKYECHYCGKRINFFNYIYIHFARAHFPQLRKYVCGHTNCTKRFASLTDKKRHMASVHTVAYQVPDEVAEKTDQAIPFYSDQPMFQ